MLDSMRGILVPLVSPCNLRGETDFGALLANFERLLASPIDGFYLCGGTGDAAAMPANERRRVAETLVPLCQSRGKTAVVHVGMTEPKTAISLAEHAAALGADAVASVPPKADWGAIEAYYRALAKVGAPVIVYYIPQMTGVVGELSDLLRILAIPGVVGIKMTDWNVFLLSQVRRHAEGAVIYSGKDEQLLYGMLAGADGAIGTWANLLPGVFCRMLALVRARNFEEALALQARFSAFLSDCAAHDVINAFERLMRAKGFAARCFREPDYPVSDFDPAPLLAQMEELP